MRNTLRFKSNIFNHSVPREYFINDCCFGDDLAAWLKGALEQKSYSVSGPDQEDWGWYLEVVGGGTRCYLNIGYVPKPDDVWQVRVEQRRGLMGRLAGERSTLGVGRLCLDLHEAVCGDGRNEQITWLRMDGRGVELDGGGVS